MASIKDLISRARQSRVGKAISGVTNRLDRDKQQSGFQFTSPQQRQSIGRGFQRVNQSVRQDPGRFNVFNQIKPRVFDPVSNFRPVSGRPSIGEAIKQTSGTVVQDFGKKLAGENTIFGKTPVLRDIAQMSSRTGQTVASGAKDIGTGVYNTFDTSKSALERFSQGGSNIIRGVGKVAGAGTLPFQLGNVGSEIGPSQTQRFSSGIVKGMTGQDDLQGLPQSNKSLNVPFLGKVDPFEQAGSMIGFTQNPINKILFKGTEKLIPSQGNALKWLATTGTRGSLEDIILNFDDVVSSDDRINKVLSVMGEGALSELVGQGLIKSGSKGFEIVGNTKGGDLLKKQLGNAGDAISEMKRKWNIPVKTLEQDPKTGEFITRPMWQVMLKNQQGGVGAKSDLLDGKVKADDVVDPKTGNVVREPTQKQVSQLEIKKEKDRLATQMINELPSETPKPQLQSQKGKIRTVVKTQGKESLDDIITGARKEIGEIKPDKLPTVKKMFQDFQTQWVNRFAPVERFSQSVKKKLKTQGASLRPENDPEFLLRRFTGAGGIADSRFKNELKPIIDSLDSRGIDKLDMDSYLKAKRDVGLGERGVSGSDTNLATKRLIAIQNKHQNIDQIAQEMYKYQNKGFEEMIEAGFMSKKSADLIRRQNPDYVPFQRIMDDEVSNYLGLPSTKLQQGTQPIKKIKGSKRKIYSPIESIIANTFSQRAAIEKNRVARSIVDLMKVDTDVDFKKVKKSSPDTITVWRDGLKEFWKVGTDIANTVKGVDEEGMNALLKIFQAPASLLRQGATGRNPDFLIPNIIKDQFDAGISSKHGFIPFVDYVSGLKSMLENDDIFKRWESSGAKIDLGEMSGRKSIQDSFNQANKRKGLLRWLGAGLDTLGKYSEQPTRVGLFKKAFKNTGSELQAVMESRDATVDFSRMGSKMKVANSVIPFLNVGIQGFDKLIRNAKSDPGKLALHAGIYGAIPAITTTLYNLQNYPEEYAEVPQYVKDSNFVMVKGRNDDGTVDYFTIPKGNIAPLITNPIENFLTFASGQNDISLGEFATQFISSSLPVIAGGNSPKEIAVKTIGQNLPQIVKPPIESLMNRSFFKFDSKKEESKEIVPYYLKKKEPFKQSYEWTPKTYKTIGAALNVSPLRIQHLAESYLAGFAKVPSQIVDIIDKTANNKEIRKNDIPILRRFLSTTFKSNGVKPVIKPEKPKTGFFERVTGKASANEGTKEKGIITKQVIDNIKDRVKYQNDVTDQELSDAYLSKLISLPSTDRYEKSLRDSKLWSSISTIESNENLSDTQKDTLNNKIATELGRPVEDLEKYGIAKQNTDTKTLHVLDQRDTMPDNQDFVRFLVQGRTPINGKILISDGVIKNLVDDGIIPKALGDDLKRIDLDEKGTLKKVKARKGKKKKVKFNFGALANLKPFSTNAIRTAGAGSTINTKKLTFSGV